MEMKRMHAVGLGGLAVIGGIAAFGAFRADEAQPAGAARSDVLVQDDEAPAPREEARDVRALATKVEALSAEVEALRALVAQQRAAEPGGSPAAGDALPSETEHQEIWEEYVSYAEAGFHDEPTDGPWAARTGSRIQEKLASWPALRSTVRSLECRSKSCRMELRDDGSTAFASELPSLVHQLGGELSSVVVDLVQDGSGQKLQVLYMKRAEASRARAL